MVTMPKPSPPRRDTRPSAHSPQAPHTFQPVELRWILKALAGTVALAMVCGTITLGVIYSRTQWQLVLHPSREVPKTPAALGLTFTEVHFAPKNNGQPQLDGWWIPSDLPSDPTVLMLHSGDGSMSDAMPQARILHDARLNVLVFDYRGFGHSSGQHPIQATMEADAESALNYLTETRKIPPSSIIVDGERSAASLAVRLCRDHNNIAALILNFPDGDFKRRPDVEDRSGKLLAWLLFDQDFPLVKPLGALATPKLIFTNSGQKYAPDFRRAADPKMVVWLESESSFAAIPQDIRRFLDAYLTRPPATLTPNP